MTPRAEKLNALIDDLTFSHGCKKTIRDLVTEITGENLQVKPKSAHWLGDRFKLGNSEYILAISGSSNDIREVAAINLINGTRRAGRASPVSSYGAMTDEEVRKIFQVSHFSSLVKLFPRGD